MSRALLCLVLIFSIELGAYATGLGTNQPIINLSQDGILRHRELFEEVGGLKEIKNLQRIALYTRVPDGVGDLVHLEEYAKYLLKKDFQVIGIARIPNSNQSALARVKNSKELYSRLGIVSFPYYGLNDKLSRDSKEINPAIKQLLNQFTTSERLDSGAFVEILPNLIEISCHYWAPQGDPGQTIARLLEYGSAEEPGPFRFYAEPGVVNSATQAVFWEKLKSEAPLLYTSIKENSFKDRPFFPGDFKTDVSMLAFVENLSSIYKDCDFYLPKNLLTPSIRRYLESNVPDLVFVSPSIQEDATEPKSIRIFFVFPLSDDTYRGLYLYPHGNIVGVSGDDTFSLALSSAKLPFVDDHNSVQQDLVQIRLVNSSHDFSELKAYFAQTSGMLALARESRREGSDEEQFQLQIETKYFKDILDNLYREWLAFAKIKYTNENGFQKLDEVIKTFYGEPNLNRPKKRQKL